jgi:L-threonylcarbamoyladenylate synthase
MNYCKIIKADPWGNFSTDIEEAARILMGGGLVAFPTESFYGLAANAMDEDGIRRIFSVKERQDKNPVLILIPCLDMLDTLVSEIPATAKELIRRFWPGGLTMVFHAGPGISSLLTANTGKIGIRLSSHPIATALTRNAGVPITGTSANLSGQPPCTNPEDVIDSIGERIDLIIDSGKTFGGKGSTILDVTTQPPSILREGMISPSEIKKIVA